VAILMASFNGEHFLPEQLVSIGQQDHVSWDLWVSDDGSNDGTLNQLEIFANGFSDFAMLESPTLPRKQHVFLLKGPRQGVAANFYHLVEKVYASAFKHYQAFAFADQDDVWFPDKLSRALSTILVCERPVSSEGAAAPLLWCSEVRVFDSRGEMKAGSITKIPHGFKPGLEHALTQNVVRGNTCVLNRAAFEQIHLCRPRTPIVMHDWWFYLVISASPGGLILHDPRPSLAYRQHEANQVGEADSFRSRVKRRRKAWQGQVRLWNDIHIAAIRELQQHASDRLIEDLWQARDKLQEVCVASRTRSLGARFRALRLLREARLRRIGWLQNLFMDFLVLTGRF